jgi:hypothetical protein
VSECSQRQPTETDALPWALPVVEDTGLEFDDTLTYYASPEPCPWIDDRD